MKNLEAQLGEAARALTVAEGQVSDWVIKTQALEVKLKEVEVEVFDARLQIRGLKDSCFSSRQTVSDRKEEIKNLKAKIWELEGKLRVVEKNPIISPKVMGKIKKDYKSSEEFVREVIEGSIDGFIKGFELCRSQVRSLLLDFDIDRLKKFLDDDEDELKVKDEMDAVVEAEVIAEIEDVAKAVIMIKDEV